MSRFKKYEHGSSWNRSTPLRLTMGEGKDAFQLKHFKVKNPDAPRCCCEMWDKFHVSQCDAPGKVQDANGDWWCNRHSPAASERVEKKREERRAAEDAKWAARQQIENAKRKAQVDVVKFREALEKIAAGHNNAMGLAREVLGIENLED